MNYLKKEVGGLVKGGEGVVRVDKKKKEMVGEFWNGGREWDGGGERTGTKTDDLVEKELGRGVGYGVYEMGKEEGWVWVGDKGDKG